MKHLLKIIKSTLLLSLFLIPSFLTSQATSAAGWDLSSLSYSYTQQFLVGGESAPEGVTFNTDGSKMFIVGTEHDDVVEYSLSTPFDVSTGSYSQSFSVVTENTIPVDVQFNNTGNKMFILGRSPSNIVYEYSLSINFDISTASYSSESFTVSEESYPTGLAFNSDGTKMFIVGSSFGDEVHEYTIGTGFDLSTTVTHIQDFSLTSEEIDPNGIAFNSNGTKMFITGHEGDDVNEYTLSPAYDISAPVHIDIVNSPFTLLSIDTGVSITSPKGIAFNGDGTRMFIIGSNRGSVYSFTLSTPFDLSTASYNSQSISVVGLEYRPEGLTFNDTGSKMFVVGYINDNVLEYTLSSNYDISTASHTQSLNVESEDGVSTGIAFNSNGTKMFITGQLGNEVNSYVLSPAFDISTASFTQQRSVYTGGEGDPEDITFNTDGTKMFILGSQQDNIDEYALSPGFDLSTASFTGTEFDVSSEETQPTGIAFSNDGTQMFITGSIGDDVLEYSLSPGFDLSTASFTGTEFDVSSEETQPHSIAFSSDGTKMFIVGNGKDFVTEYSNPPVNVPEFSTYVYILTLVVLIGFGYHKLSKTNLAK